MYYNFSASYVLHITCKHPYRPRGRHAGAGVMRQGFDLCLRAADPPSSSQHSAFMALEATCDAPRVASGPTSARGLLATLHAGYQLTWTELSAEQREEMQRAQIARADKAK